MIQQNCFFHVGNCEYEVNMNDIIAVYCNDNLSFHVPSDRGYPILYAHNVTRVTIECTRYLK